MIKASLILDRLICQIGLESALRLFTIQKKWCQIFEKDLIAHMYPSDLRDGILIINVDSPLWLKELSYLKENILDRLKGLNIKDLRFRIGRITPVQHEDEIERDYQLFSKAPDHIPDYLNDDIKEIKDQELKAHIVSIANRVRRLQCSEV